MTLMIRIFSPAMALAVILSAQPMLAQTLLPVESRQVQFIWESTDAAYQGRSNAELDSIFIQLAHESGTFGLALNRRTSVLMSSAAFATEELATRTCNLIPANDRLRPGPQTFTLPSAALDSAWLNGNWHLIIDGVEFGCVPDVPVLLDIPSGAEATSIGLKCVTEGETLEAHVLFPISGTASCPEPDLPPWPASNENDPHWLGVFANGQPVVGQALIKLGDDGVFDRPIILLEGFDPDLQGNAPAFGFGDLNWEVIWGCTGTENSAIANLAFALDSLTAIGFDVVFLDFENGTQSVEVQSKLVEHVLDLCRLYREGTEPLVLIGPSMGGVVGRYALRSMELSGMEHCTRLFIAIDSPFRGAHLPIALQESIAFFAEISADAQALHQALLSPAAAQLLVGSPFHAPDVRANLEALQEEIGLPRKPTTMALANGHISAPFVTPTLWYQANESILGWDLVDINLWSQPGFADHPESSPDQWVIFDATLFNTGWNWGEPLQFNGLAWNACGNSLNYETMPGSHSAHLGQFTSALQQVGIWPQTYQSHSMFIPVKSALDCPLLQPFEPTEIAFDHWAMEPEGSGSAFHCDVNSFLDLIWQALVEGQNVQDVNALNGANAIHLGWSRPHATRLSALPLESSADVEIGTDQANGPGEWPVFEATIAPCSPPFVTASNHTFLIGDTVGGGRAQFTLPENASWDIAGTVHIGPHSTLIIEPNALVNLAGGKIIVHPFGSIQHQAEGRIEVSASSEVLLTGSTAVWNMAGDLIIHEQDTLSITSSTSNSMGTWKWAGDAVYSHIHDNGCLSFSGSLGAVGTIALLDHSGHSITGDGTMKIHRANINLGDTSLWNLMTRVSLHHCHLHGSGNSSELVSQRRLTWNEGTFEQGDFYASNGEIAAIQLHSVNGTNAAFCFDSIGVRLDGCQFDDASIQGSNWKENSVIQDCEFVGGMGTAPQILLMNGEFPIRMEGNTFRTHPVGLTVDRATVHSSCNTWHDFTTAIILSDSGHFNAADPAGMNHWWDNGIHILCDHAQLPDFAGGHNHMENAEDALFLGSVYWGGNPPLGSPFCTIDQPANMWPGASPGIPLTIPYTGLTVALTGVEVFFKDSSPTSAPCPLANPAEHHAQVKNSDQPIAPLTANAWSCFPNPASQRVTIQRPLDDAEHAAFSVRLMDLGGRIVLMQHLVMGNEPEATVDVSHVPIGVYSIEITDATHAIVHRSTLLIER